MSVPENVIPDYQLVAGCVANDRKAQEQLYKRFYNPMMALCYRYTKNEEDAIEVLHEGLLKVFQHIGNYDIGKSALYTWIHTIMVRTAIDFLRKKKLEVSTVEWTESNEPTIQPETIIDKSAEEILYFLKQLPEMAAAVFNLYVIEGYKHKEISQLLDISEGTSKWHLSEAKKQLTICFEKRTIFFNGK
ncbi:MAG: RNA polymerase sigma factor [Chitinophagaceae bacterium]|nr:RNA polymerase sigma factor [Chitinophagaceae bacterium]